MLVHTLQIVYLEYCVPTINFSQGSNVIKALACIYFLEFWHQMYIIYSKFSTWCMCMVQWTSIHMWRIGEKKLWVYNYLLSILLIFHFFSKNSGYYLLFVFYYFNNIIIIAILITSLYIRTKSVRTFILPASWATRFQRIQIEKFSSIWYQTVVV